LDEEAISRAMREVRLALLEADVNFEVVKDFVVACASARSARTCSRA
jgi:signal recognition particle subunit SRP54